jgi:hypothetical protein
MNKNPIRIESYMSFENNAITDVMDWSIECLLSKIWMDPVWMKCAKGGNETESYAYKNDMYYAVHIFSGIAMALKVLDYKYMKYSESIDKNKLKRAIFGYMFHDFNKLGNYSENIKMQDRSLLDSELGKFDDIMKELGLSKDDVYFIAISTEKGTQFRLNSDNNKIGDDLRLESNFSRLADSLSSAFSDEPEELQDIYFDNQPCIPASNIFSIRINSSLFVTTSSFLRKVLADVIKLQNGFYLWSTLNTIYYVADSPVVLDNKELANKLLSDIAEHSKLELGIHFTDRKIDFTSSYIGKVTNKVLIDYIKHGKNFHDVLHLEDIKLTDEILDNAKKYSDLINGFKSFSLNFYKDFPMKGNSKLKSVREYLETFDIDPEEEENMVWERLRILYIRYIQLQTTMKDQNAEKIRALLDEVLNEHEDVLNGLLPKANKAKSAFLIPLLITFKSDKIDWDEMQSSILKDINKDSENENNLETATEIIDIILNNINAEIPEVPEKMQMSMISGYPAKAEAHGENLFGLGTNSFNNRLPTSGISNGKIDPMAIFEFSLRHILAPRVNSKYSSAVMFLSFPGAIPFMNMGKFINELFKKDSNLKVNNINLTLDDGNSKLDNFKFDSTYYIFLNDPKKDSEMLYYLQKAINIAKATKLHVLISFSNNLFYETWKESILIDIESSVLNGMGWNKLRCNNLERVNAEINFFLDASKDKTKIDYESASTVLKDYLRDNFSLSYYVHKQFFGNNSKILSNMDKIDLMRKLVYGKKVDRMKKLEEMGKIASELYRLNWKSSASDRGWMLRESLEVIEKMKAETNTSNINDLKDFVLGHLYKGLERLIRRDNSASKYTPDKIKLKDFVDILFSLINEEFKAKIPSGITRSYLIDAYEIEYMLASNEKYKKYEKGENNE